MKSISNNNIVIPCFGHVVRGSDYQVCVNDGTAGPAKESSRVTHFSQAPNYNIMYVS